jgi:hypothetical protein
MLYPTTRFQKIGALVCMLIGATVNAQAEPPVPISPHPGWVLDISANLDSKVPQENISRGVHYLLVDTQIRVGDGNKTEYFSHYAERVLNQTGVESNSQITIEFDPTYESLTLHKIVVWRDNHAVSKLGTARMSLVNREEDLENLMYNGRKTLHVILDDVRVGDTIEYSFTHKGDNPIYNGIFSYSHALNWSVPVQRMALTVHWNKQAPLYHQITNSDLSLKTTKTAGGMRYQLDQINVEPLIEEKNLPEWFTPYGTAYFSESASWRQVADWARPLMESGVEGNNEIRKIAERIITQHGDPTDQIAASLQYVQEEIRYFGIEIGDNSHRPSKASATLARRYGDCKDKTVLLISILRELGIEAHPALVNTRRQKSINDIIPNARQFDHVIARVTHDGKAYWLDPTRQYQYGGLHAIYQPDFGYALVLRPNTYSLTAMSPEQAPSAVVIRDSFDLTAGKDAPVSYTVHTTNTGLEAEKIRLRKASKSPNEIQEEYLDFYREYYAHIKSASPIAFIDSPELNKLTVEEQYTIEGLWQLDENDHRNYASFYNNVVSPYLKSPKEKQRKHPLALPHPVNVRQVIEVRLDERQWNFDDEKFSEDNDIFSFTYAARFDQTKKLLTLEYSYQSKINHLPASRMPDYLAALERSNSYMDYRIFSGSLSAAEDEGQEINYFSWIVGLFALVSVVAIVLWRIDAARHPYSGEMTYYPVAPPKFIALWSLTFGIYGCYWFYRNWKYVRQRDQSSIMPIARSIFYVFWYYPLFKDLREDSSRRHGRAQLPAPFVGVVLAVAFFAINASASVSGYDFLFSGIASLLMLPMVISINNINGHADAAYQHNSRWRIHHYLLILLATPLLLLALGSETGLTPSDRVIAGKKLPSYDIKFLQRNGAIAPADNIIYFYSDAILSNRDDGNGYTDRHVFSYWRENGEFHLNTAGYADIKDIQVTRGDLLDATTIKVIRQDESWFILYASPIKKMDQLFINGLQERWKKATQKVEAVPPGENPGSGGE